MKVEFDKSFSKSIDKLKNKQIKEKIIKFIEIAEKVEDIYSLSSIKKLKGDKISYRKKIGDYRIGFEINEDTIYFIIVAHRKEIYRFFPK